jgi:hypothetical protein
MLKLLSNRLPIDFEETDTRGWTFLQRAVAFGTTTDVEQIIKMYRGAGLPLRRKYTSMSWEVISYAVLASNLETLNVLLSLYGNEVHNVLDREGRTLLDLATTRACFSAKQNYDTKSQAVAQRLIKAGVVNNEHKPLDPANAALTAEAGAKPLCPCT